MAHIYRLRDRLHEYKEVKTPPFLFSLKRWFRWRIQELLTKNLNYYSYTILCIKIFQFHILIMLMRKKKFSFFYYHTNFSLLLPLPQKFCYQTLYPSLTFNLNTHWCWSLQIFLFTQNMM